MSGQGLHPSPPGDTGSRSVLGTLQEQKPHWVSSLNTPVLQHTTVLAGTEELEAEGTQIGTPHWACCSCGWRNVLLA